MKNDEANIQAAILEYIRAAAPHVKPYHNANGGYRTKREAARLKWQGVLAGVFDITLIWRPRMIAYIEVKTKVGRLSPAQKAFGTLLDDMLIPWAIARSVEDAREALAEFGIETREAKAAA